MLAATARGETEAFGSFYRRYERRVLGYAISRCANSSDVADVVADTFVAALSSAGRFRSGDGDALPWLLGIARHVLARQRRSFFRRQRLAGRLKTAPQFTGDEAEAIDAAIHAARLAPQLRSAMATLRATDRELLLLVARDGLTPAQAGAAVGMNPNTARLRLSRARQRLRSVLVEPTPTEPQEIPDVHP
ncbi:MAG TPA: sigma-70 family RNA polymerase sigma factor [Acidimicrobiales bacterium]|nr:sigma-70 family RNA polymerase sigma factor [Acidimicrobiales bacterium]